MTSGAKFDFNGELLRRIHIKSRNKFAFCVNHQTSSVQKPTPLITQFSNWDCGLTCVLMILKSVREEEWSLESLSEICKTKSVWTIDLAYLLKTVDLPFVFLTTRIGTDPDFSSIPYYARHLDQDRIRVDSLFKNASSTGIPVVHRSLHLSELRALCLASNCLVILLVNQRKLHVFTSVLYCMNIDLGLGDVFGYQGHYILLTGYDEVRKRFLVNDPAKAYQYWISEYAIEEAHRSYGTDEDALVVFSDHLQSHFFLSQVHSEDVFST